jgi:hypothetical protein
VKRRRRRTKGGFSNGAVERRRARKINARKKRMQAFLARCSARKGSRRKLLL